MNYAPFAVQNPGSPPENMAARGLSGSAAEVRQRNFRRERLFFDVENSFMGVQAEHLKGDERSRFADASKAHKDVYQRAFSLTVSTEGDVFSFRGEPPRMMEEYGNTNFGRSALLARRLVEAGVSAVEINLGGWDTHAQNFQALRTRQLPPLDQGM